MQVHMGLSSGGLRTADNLTHQGVYAEIHMKSDKHMKLEGFHFFSIVLLRWLKKIQSTLTHAEKYF